MFTLLQISIGSAIVALLVLLFRSGYRDFVSREETKASDDVYAAVVLDAQGNHSEAGHHGQTDAGSGAHH
jgi:hypothetical protein